VKGEEGMSRTKIIKLSKAECVAFKNIAKRADSSLVTMSLECGRNENYYTDIFKKGFIGSDALAAAKLWCKLKGFDYNAELAEVIAGEAIKETAKETAKDTAVIEVKPQQPLQIQTVQNVNIFLNSAPDWLDGFEECWRFCRLIVDSNRNGSFTEEQLNAMFPTTANPETLEAFSYTALAAYSFAKAEGWIEDKKQ
jgi:hypothetical protein